MIPIENVLKAQSALFDIAPAENGNLLYKIWRLTSVCEYGIVVDMGKTYTGMAILADHDGKILEFTEVEPDFISAPVDWAYAIGLNDNYHGLIGLPADDFSEEIERRLAKKG